MIELLKRLEEIERDKEIESTDKNIKSLLLN